MIPAPQPSACPVTIALTVNGTLHRLTVEPHRLLVEVLRDMLGLTGTHIGCETSQCGCCTVLMDGRSVKACAVLAVQADGRTVVTIEGLAAPDGTLHPMQAAFTRNHALQCGFCTPGMILAAVDLLRLIPEPTEVQVREGLRGVFCRCTGYQNIVAAVLEVAAQTSGDAAAKGVP